MDQLDSDVNQRAFSIIAAGLLAGAILAPARACAHAFPSAEQPHAGATLQAPPSQVTITFDAPIESLFATLEVLDGAGHNEAAGAPRLGAKRRELSVALRPLGPGAYTVRWAVVAEDGHRTEGSYTFTVAGGVAR